MATDVMSNEPILAVPLECFPVVDHLVTEDDTPVDSFFSEKQMRLLTEPLTHLPGVGPRTAAVLRRCGQRGVVSFRSIARRRRPTSAEHGRSIARRRPRQETITRNSFWKMASRRMS